MFVVYKLHIFTMFYLYSLRIIKQSNKTVFKILQPSLYCKTELFIHEHKFEPHQRTKGRDENLILQVKNMQAPRVSHTVLQIIHGYFVLPLYGPSCTSCIASQTEIRNYMYLLPVAISSALCLVK